MTATWDRDQGTLTISHGWGWVKHRLPVSTPDLLSWAPTGGLGLFPWVTVKPVVTRTSGLFPCSGHG